jgi:hypothetical protein
VCCRRGLIWPSAGLDYGTSKAVALNGCIKIFVYLGLGALAVRRKDCLAAYRCEDTGQLCAKQLQAACLLVCAASLKQKAARSHAYPLLRRAELAFLAAAVSEGGPEGPVIQTGCSTTQCSRPIRCWRKSGKPSMGPQRPGVRMSFDRLTQTRSPFARPRQASERAIEQIDGDLTNTEPCTSFCREGVSVRISFERDLNQLWRNPRARLWRVLLAGTSGRLPGL